VIFTGLGSAARQTLAQNARVNAIKVIAREFILIIFLGSALWKGECYSNYETINRERIFLLAMRWDNKKPALP
jgi:hypothetical protein